MKKINNGGNIFSSLPTWLNWLRPLMVLSLTVVTRRLNIKTRS